MKCSMCGKPIARVEDVLFKGKPICAECAENLQCLLESDDMQAVARAFDYIYDCQTKSSDEEVSKYLDQLMYDNKSANENDKEIKSEYLDSQKPQESANEPKSSVSDIFKVFSYLTWFLGFIGAIELASEMNNATWFIVVAAACFVAGCMPLAISYILKYLAIIAYNTTPNKDTTDK